MAVILYIANAISLATTEALIDYGYAFGPGGNVTGATNTSPIVLTLDTNCGFPEGSHIHTVVAGVGGNTAANGTVIAKVLTQTTLALYTNQQARYAPIAGSGAYTGGGTWQTAFPDGRILLGAENVNNETSPPHIVFVPTDSRFDMKPTPSAGVGPNGTLAAQLSNAWTWTDAKRFGVEVWAAQYINGVLASDFDQDWAFLENTRDILIQQISLLMMGAFRLNPGKWSESKPRDAKYDIVGRRFEFTLDIMSPVLPTAVSLVPPGTSGRLIVYPSTTSSSGSDAITIIVP